MEAYDLSHLATSEPGTSALGDRSLVSVQIKQRCFAYKDVRECRSAVALATSRGGWSHMYSLVLYGASKAVECVRQRTSRTRRCTRLSSIPVRRAADW